jgi:hypothetical protein
MTEHIVMGMRDNWGQETPFSLSPHDRRHHLYTIGKSGAGKTTMLRNLILQDIEAGRGVAVIDPHGDLADDILDHIPRHRTEDVVYFNPADLEYPVGMNLLGSVPKDERHLVASGIISIFRGIWSEFWGPRLEYILYACVAALLDCENVTGRIGSHFTAGRCRQAARSMADGKQSFVGRGRSTEPSDRS